MNSLEFLILLAVFAAVIHLIFIIKVFTVNVGWGITLLVGPGLAKALLGKGPAGLVIASLFFWAFAFLYWKEMKNWILMILGLQIVIWLAVGAFWLDQAKGKDVSAERIAKILSQGFGGKKTHQARSKQDSFFGSVKGFRRSESQEVQRPQQVSLDLFQAVQNRDYQGMIKRHGLGDDVNMRSPSGDTPLMEAVKNGDRDAVILLLDLEADPGLMNEDGWTALDLAEENNDTAIADLLTAN